MNAPDPSKLFSAALDSLMQERGVNQIELHRRAGIAVSRVNNYLRGRFRTITPAHLAAIHEAFGGVGATALVQAYLLDRISGECQRWVDIRVRGARHTGRWQVPSKGLKPDFVAALKDLYLLCVSNVQVRRRTAEWIAIMRETKG